MAICGDIECISGSLLKPTLVLLVQLWNANKNLVVNNDTFSNLQLSSQIVEILKDSKLAKFKVGRFAACYFVSTFPVKESAQLLELIDLSNADLANFVVSKVIDFIASNTALNENERLILVDIVKYMVKEARTQLLDILAKRDLQLSDLELRLQSSIMDTVVEENDDIVEKYFDDDVVDENVEVFEFSSVEVESSSYLNLANDLEFEAVLSSLLKMCSSIKVKAQNLRFCSFVTRYLSLWMLPYHSCFVHLSLRLFHLASESTLLKLSLQELKRLQMAKLTSIYWCLYYYWVFILSLKASVWQFHK